MGLPAFAGAGVLFHFGSHHVPVPVRLLCEALLFGGEARLPMGAGLERLRNALVSGGLCLRGGRRCHEDLERMVGHGRRRMFVSEEPVPFLLGFAVSMTRPQSSFRPDVMRSVCLA